MASTSSNSRNPSVVDLLSILGSFQSRSASYHSDLVQLIETTKTRLLEIEKKAETLEAENAKFRRQLARNAIKSKCSSCEDMQEALEHLKKSHAAQILQKDRLIGQLESVLQQQSQSPATNTEKGRAYPIASAAAAFQQSPSCDAATAIVPEPQQQQCFQSLLPPASQIRPVACSTQIGAGGSTPGPGQGGLVAGPGATTEVLNGPEGRQPSRLVPPSKVDEVHHEDSVSSSRSQTCGTIRGPGGAVLTKNGKTTKTAVGLKKNVPGSQSRNENGDGKDVVDGGVPQTKNAPVRCKTKANTAASTGGWIRPTKSTSLTTGHSSLSSSSGDRTKGSQNVIPTASSSSAAGPQRSSSSSGSSPLSDVNVNHGAGGVGGGGGDQSIPPEDPNPKSSFDLAGLGGAETIVVSSQCSKATKLLDDGRKKNFLGGGRKPENGAQPASGGSHEAEQPGESERPPSPVLGRCPAPGNRPPNLSGRIIPRGAPGMDLGENNLPKPSNFCDAKNDAVVGSSKGEPKNPPRLLTNATAIHKTNVQQKRATMAEELISPDLFLDGRLSDVADTAFSAIDSPTLLSSPRQTSKRARPRTSQQHPLGFGDVMAPAATGSSDPPRNDGNGSSADPPMKIPALENLLATPPSSIHAGSVVVVRDRIDKQIDNRQPVTKALSSKHPPGPAYAVTGAGVGAGDLRHPRKFVEDSNPRKLQSKMMTSLPTANNASGGGGGKKMVQTTLTQAPAVIAEEEVGDDYEIIPSSQESSVRSCSPTAVSQLHPAVDPVNYNKIEKKATPPELKVATKEPVRKLAERQKLAAQGCKQCEEYYAAAGSDLAETARRIQETCRHRARTHAPPVPDAYWEVDFPTTQECKERGIMNTTQYLSREEVGGGTSKNALARLRAKRKRPAAAAVAGTAGVAGAGAGTGSKKPAN